MQLKNFQTSETNHLRVEIEDNGDITLTDVERTPTEGFVFHGKITIPAKQRDNVALFIAL